MLQNVVGLFGTCGSSKWRAPIMTQLDLVGIKYFNPVVEDWTPECRANEVHHASTDKVIVTVITGETEGVGSLAELGWMALGAKERGQYLVIFIEDHPDKSNNKVRDLVRKYIIDAEESMPQLYLVNSVEEIVPTVIDILKQKETE